MKLFFYNLQEYHFPHYLPVLDIINIFAKLEWEMLPLVIHYIPPMLMKLSFFNVSCLNCISFFLQIFSLHFSQFFFSHGSLFFKLIYIYLYKIHMHMKDFFLFGQKYLLKIFVDCVILGRRQKRWGLRRENKLYCDLIVLFCRESYPCCLEKQIALCKI